MSETQNYQNHVRYFPLFHFVITPLLLVMLIWQIVRLVQDFNVDRVFNLLLVIVLTLISLAARMQALKAQDRVVRLEEQLRYKQLLPKDLAQKALSLRTNQMIALRFASDEELPELVQKTLNGELKDSKEIKLAVKNWRGDYLRV
jgi:L-cystine uptake protein TcyP (sodium:dicarboxylate symporter family)